MEDDDLADSETTPHKYSYASLPEESGGDFWEEIETKLKNHTIGADIPHEH